MPETDFGFVGQPLVALSFGPAGRPRGGGEGGQKKPGEYGAGLGELLLGQRGSGRTFPAVAALPPGATVRAIAQCGLSRNAAQTCGDFSLISAGNSVPRNTGQYGGNTGSVWQ